MKNRRWLRRKLMSLRDSQPNPANNLPLVIIVSLALLFCTALPLSLNPQNVPSAPSLLPGQSATTLPDGKWLLVGGETSKGSLSTVSIWDPRTNITSQLSSQLQNARAWHTATMLPDGTVFIFGGVGSNGQIVKVAEVFDPDSQTVSVLPSTGLTGRARHTATLLTDGQVLLAGGIGDNRKTLDSAQMFDPETHSSELIAQSFSSPRRNHSATLLPDGRVLIWGGMHGDGHPLSNGELFDPSSEGFTLLQSYPSFLLPQSSDGAILMASIPVDRSVDVPTDTMISLRFSKPLRKETLNSQTITLSGPKGVEEIKVVPAENGSLAFITPEAPLLPGSTYTVTINGAVDRDGLLLPVSGISFSTEPLPSDGQPAGDPSNGSGPQPTVQPPPSGSDLDDGWTWTGTLKDGKPHSPWQDLPPLQADPGVTALAGQLLDLKGDPLAKVTLKIEGTYGSEGTTVQ